MAIYYPLRFGGKEGEERKGVGGWGACSQNGYLEPFNIVRCFVAANLHGKYVNHVIVRCTNCTTSSQIEC